MSLQLLHNFSSSKNVWNKPVWFITEGNKITHVTISEHSCKQEYCELWQKMNLILTYQNKRGSYSRDTSLMEREHFKGKRKQEKKLFIFFFYLETNVFPNFFFSEKKTREHTDCGNRKGGDFMMVERGWKQIKLVTTDCTVSSPKLTREKKAKKFFSQCYLIEQDSFSSFPHTLSLCPSIIVHVFLIFSHPTHNLREISVECREHLNSWATVEGWKI